MASITFFIHMLRSAVARPLCALARSTTAALWIVSPGLATAEPAQGGDSASAGAPWRHAIAMHGDPALPLDFTHFPYADPQARVGGEMRLGAHGAFENLNPLTLGGQPFWPIRHHVVESLMARNRDEPFSLYGLLAEAIATPEDRSFVAFRLRPEARFSDGTPVTIDDLIWSMETLRDKGRPNHRRYYKQISKVERLGPRSVKFHFEKADRELPLLIGLMPVISRADWDGVDFQKSGFRPPLGSGPYRVAKVDPGRAVLLERNADYWGRDLPVNAGRYQLERLNYLYFRDYGSMWEAFKAGDLDLFIESNPLRWRDVYNFPAVRDGRISRREIPLRTPSGMEGFVFNTRRPLFQDRRVRRALALAFNYTWVNETYFAGKMRRITSYFSGSPLGFDGPAEGEEARILAPFASSLPKSVLSEGWRPPVYARRVEHRAGLLEAKRLLEEAGWRVKDMALQNDEGRPFVFEILIDQRRHERIARSFADDLEWLGVQARVRQIDSTQRTRRTRNYDYDMIVYRWRFSLSPGQEQRFRFGSDGRKEKGTLNYMGVADPAVDALVDALLAAKTREAFRTAVRAYDRVLSAGVYVIPWGWRDEDWVAHDAGLRIPAKTSASGFMQDVVWRPAADRTAQSDTRPR